MSVLERTLLEVAVVLDALKVPYMMVGGLANAVWGEPRATIDVDVTVWVDESALSGFIARLSETFRILVEHPLDFARQTRVVPLESREGVRVDVILGLLPFEREALERAVTVQIAGSPVRVVTAEDLIIMKIASTRPRDLDDARGVARRRRAELDLAYLEPRIAELAALLERPEIQGLWAMWKEADP